MFCQLGVRCVFIVFFTLMALPDVRCVCIQYAETMLKLVIFKKHNTHFLCFCLLAGNPCHPHSSLFVPGRLLRERK